jgi:large subunit ribosomal protein L28
MVTGKSVLSGNNVSHANNKTRRRFLPNLQSKKLMSDALGHPVRIRISSNALRTIESAGGLDTFLMKTKDAQLDPKIVRIKKVIAEKIEAKQA